VPEVNLPLQAKHPRAPTPLQKSDSAQQQRRQLRALAFRPHRALRGRRQRHKAVEADGLKYFGRTNRA